MEVADDFARSEVLDGMVAVWIVGSELENPEFGAFDLKVGVIGGSYVARLGAY